MLCSRCHEKMAIVFITKIEDGVSKNEGLCVSCAKELGIGNIDQLMAQMGIDEQEFEEMSKDFIENSPGLTPEMFQSAMPMLQDFFHGNKAEKEPVNPVHDADEPSTKQTKTKTAGRNQKKSMIEQFSTNLTKKAQNQEIDRVIGRDVEIERVAQILNRRTKNNPVLIGEPGVGKTAIAEGLAVRIASGQAPHKLLSKEIYLLDLAAVVAGTQFRGQFEARMKAIIDEAKERGNVIFVIDELHNIVAAGDSEGAMGAANILKPALAKGQIQVIGATTLEEYRKHIEKDSALERRFQPVLVEEPSVEETIEIIKGIRDYYEKHHLIKISDDVIRTATVLAQRYVTDRFLPDKAIDVIDEAGARVNLHNVRLVELEQLRMALQEIQEEKESAVASDSIEEYQKAANLKIRECQLLERIDQLEKDCCNTPLTVDDVAQVVEMWTKIPVKRISEFESNKLMSLENRLHERLIGQNNAVEAVARAVRVSRAGISGKRRPVSFIFVGPTGVGKTELVRQLARELFDDEHAMIRLDMSEYMEKHTVSKMIGSPPGYVGYDDAGQLTEKVRRRPYSVILLDEIEKAHPDVFNLLLQILDEGRITDSHGKLVNFENCVIIMTSNAGSDLQTSTLGFQTVRGESTRNKVDTALKQIFRPEFLNRIDDIVIFDALDKEQLHGICTLMLGDLAKGLAEKGISLECTDSLKNYLIEKGYDEKYGARPMRRVIYKDVETKIAELLLTEQIGYGSQVFVTAEDGKVIITQKDG